NYKHKQSKQITEKVSKKPPLDTNTNQPKKTIHPNTIKNKNKNKKKPKKKNPKKKKQKKQK
ncbi:hypothetical protein, partial [Enterococcus faecalis]|uniref:hypothetical protein n=1 Tax=Enterococcus faecalis TaxID=1351 RepID=UPI003CC6B93D